MDIRIPNLAEGISSGTVVSVLVAEGDKVVVGQTLIELETEKAVAPIPSPSAGTVRKIDVAVGDAVTVGKKFMTIAEAGASPDVPAAAELPEAKVGRSEPVRSEPAQSMPSPGIQGTGVSDYRYESKNGLPPPAAPSVRKIARELGIELENVRGSAAGGRITVEDLRAYIQRLKTGVQRAVCAAPPEQKPVAKPVPVDFSKFGPVIRKPMSNLRKKISEKMSESWTTIPHVTQFAQADVTELAKLRERYLAAYEKSGARLTLTGLILKALVKTLRQFPVFNASLDEAAGEIVTKDSIHLGLAVDTEQGLIVPVIRDADKKSVLELSKAVSELAEKTKSRKIGIEDLQGGSFTVSNQGGIGGSYFTPIINKPEVAILGLGKAETVPALRKGKIAAATLLPLCLSYDHRLIDGGSAARFVTDLKTRLENFDETDVRLPGPVKTASAKSPARRKKRA
jgi:pyruvate dehydrogenase E2 component (dihydrolipoamide acetyltransferase)